MTETRPTWPAKVLLAAALYNGLWGAVVILFPNTTFEFFARESLSHPAIWQCLGMVIGVYGLGYWLASLDPFRHWPIVLVGLLGKTFGPLGFLWTAWQGQLPWTFAWMLVLNDLIWWYPFAATLYLAFRWNNNPANFVKGATYDEAIRLTRSQRGETLEKISFHGLTMVVFLRHAGCTFCRETLSDMRQIRQDLEQLGIQTAIVHMGRPLDGTTMLSKYDLDHMHHFSDPGCRLYRAFGLERGNWSQLFSWGVLKRGLWAGLKEGHGMGKLAGDSFQLPGVFFLSEGRVILSHPTASAAERINYLDLVQQAIRNWEALNKPASSRSQSSASV